MLCGNFHTQQAKWSFLAKKVICNNNSIRDRRSNTNTRRSIVIGAGGILSGTTSLLVAGMGIASAATAAVVSAAASAPQSLVRSGMKKFEEGNVLGSIEDFDAALASKPSIRPYLWQRGLSLYYSEEYAKGAQQFRDDVAVNPNDTEEAIWAFLCEAKLIGPENARNQFLKVGRDSRPVMRAAEEAFRTGCGTDVIEKAANGDTQGHAAFYSLLYIGLWNEAEGNVEKAKDAMLRASNTEYGRLSGDYMAALAKVHCRLRGWL